MGRTIKLGPGVEIIVDDQTRRRLLVELADEPEADGAAGPVTDLPPDHPMWGHHSGGDRHATPEYSDGDEDAARKLRRGLSPKAKVFFEEILTRPGHLFESQHFLDTFHDVFESHNAVAGCLHGFTRHCERDGRSFPFYWWEGREGTPTRYAIHPHVARVFLRAGD